MRESQKRLGVVGGLGPLATALFLELIVKNTKAPVDQEHLDVILYSIPRIPDRTAFILEKSDQSPLPMLTEYAKKLEGYAVDAIAIPCVTFSYFYESLLQTVNTKLIHPIGETVKALASSGVKKAGIMATSGTLYTKLFQTELEKHNIDWVAPSSQVQTDIMDIIYGGIKAGKRVTPERLSRVGESFFVQGCDAVILGCTELSVITNQNCFDDRYFDVLEILAQASIKACGGTLVGE